MMTAFMPISIYQHFVRWDLVPTVMLLVSCVAGTSSVIDYLSLLLSDPNNNPKSRDKYPLIKSLYWANIISLYCDSYGFKPNNLLPSWRNSSIPTHALHYHLTMEMTPFEVNRLINSHRFFYNFLSG
jgi:hypothetical protein